MPQWRRLTKHEADHLRSVAPWDFLCHLLVEHKLVLAGRTLACILMGIHPPQLKSLALFPRSHFGTPCHCTVPHVCPGGFWTADRGVEGAMAVVVDWLKEHKVVHVNLSEASVSINWRGEPWVKIVEFLSPGEQPVQEPACFFLEKAPFDINQCALWFEPRTFDDAPSKEAKIARPEDLCLGLSSQCSAALDRKEIIYINEPLLWTDYACSELLVYEGLGVDVAAALALLRALDPTLIPHYQTLYEPDIVPLHPLLNAHLRALTADGFRPSLRLHQQKVEGKSVEDQASAGPLWIRATDCDLAVLQAMREYAMLQSLIQSSSQGALVVQTAQRMYAAQLTLLEERIVAARRPHQTKYLVERQSFLVARVAPKRRTLGSKRKAEDQGQRLGEVGEPAGGLLPAYGSWLLPNPRRTVTETVPTRTKITAEEDVCLIQTATKAQNWLSVQQLPNGGIAIQSDQEGMTIVDRGVTRELGDVFFHYWLPREKLWAAVREALLAWFPGDIVQLLCEFCNVDKVSTLRSHPSTWLLKKSVLDAATLTWQQLPSQDISGGDSWILAGTELEEGSVKDLSDLFVFGVHYAHSGGQSDLAVTSMSHRAQRPTSRKLKAPGRSEDKKKRKGSDKVVDWGAELLIAGSSQAWVLDPWIGELVELPPPPGQAAKSLLFYSYPYVVRQAKGSDELSLFEYVRKLSEGKDQQQQVEKLEENESKITRSWKVVRRLRRRHGTTDRVAGTDRVVGLRVKAESVTVINETGFSLFKAPSAGAEVQASKEKEGQMSKEKEGQELVLEEVLFYPFHSEVGPAASCFWTPQEGLWLTTETGVFSCSPKLDLSLRVAGRFVTAGTVALTAAGPRVVMACSQALNPKPALSDSDDSDDDQPG